MATSVTQFGITWTFNADYTVGTYINGDSYVVDPGAGCVINSITQTNAAAGHDGSMIDPIPSTTAHGYDDRIPGYTSALNVADSGDFPITINPGTGEAISLVSSISKDISDAGARPVLDVAAILTVVASAPAANSFRPAYAGASSTKVLTHTTADVDTAELLSLTPPTGTPTIAAMEALIEKPWIDHRTEWQGDYLHPSQNMENYGGGMSRDSNDIALRLLLNDTVSAKLTLLYRFIQLGIDNYGLVVNGAQWGSPGGTIGVGRKLPILFAGLLLGNTAMNAVATTYNTRAVFQEDGQTFDLTQDERDATYDPVNAAAGSAYNWPGWYDGYAIGSARWGERHYRYTLGGYNYLPGKIDYRGITRSSSLGAAVVVDLLSLETVWNHDPFIDWQATMEDEGVSGTWGSTFSVNMWADFYVGSPAAGVTANVTFDAPDGGILYQEYLTMTCATGSSTIYYTTDGSIPDNTDSVYSSPIAIYPTDTTVRAFATSGGNTDSSVSQVVYWHGSYPSINDSWENIYVPAKVINGFTCTVTPAALALDALIALSFGEIGTPTDAAMIIRLYTDNTFQVRNGGAYASAVTTSYVAGGSYDISIRNINWTAKTYDVYVDDVLITSNYAFRTEQSSITQIDNVGIIDYTQEGITLTNVSYQTSPLAIKSQSASSALLI
tara:strand:- start:13990 stop:15990 length:2001 start_codon:yes stop_codon:yes gene_type:complete